MLLENAIRKLVEANIPKNEISIDYDNITDNVNFDNEPEYSEDIVEMISEFSMLILSCYVQPIYLNSSATAVFSDGTQLPIYQYEKPLEKLMVYYNFNGEAIDSSDKKIEFTGKNIGDYILNFNENILYTMDFAYLKSGQFCENKNIIELLPFGGKYSFGDNPALIEQKLCHISQNNGELQIKNSKLSDWKNLGISFNQKKIFIKELQKNMIYSADLSELQKLNLAEIITGGNIKVQLKNNSINNDVIQFSSRYFKHILGTNYMNIIFIKS